MNNLTNKSFNDNLSKLTGTKLFLDLSNLSLEEIFYEYTHKIDDIDFIYPEPDMVYVWPKREAVLSSVFFPKPSSDLIKILNRYEENEPVLTSDCNLPIKESFYICCLADRDFVSMFSISEMQQIKGSMISFTNYKDSFLIVANLLSFINKE